MSAEPSPSIDSQEAALLTLVLQCALVRYAAKARDAKSLAEYDRPARIRDGLTLTLAALAESEYNNQPESAQ